MNYIIIGFYRLSNNNISMEKKNSSVYSIYLWETNK